MKLSVESSKLQRHYKKTLNKWQNQSHVANAYAANLVSYNAVSQRDLTASASNFSMLSIGIYQTLSIQTNSLILVRKSEIQPLVSLILGCAQILIPLCRRHRIPDGVSALVPPRIIVLDGKNQETCPCNQSQDCFVTSSIVWRIIGPVNLNVIVSFCEQMARGGKRNSHLRQ